ncbi:MAG TPA: hypothetical protein DCW97_05580, partial [Acidobacteria bacterium]|nr:hypothetical protein [Acidobacteriota bacterium]
MTKIRPGKISWLFLGFLIINILGCSTFTQSYKLGYQAEINKNYDEAIKYYEQAMLENPKESVYRLALFRTKAVAALDAAERARRLAAGGMKDEALNQYKKALFYDPTNRMILAEYKELAGIKPAVEVKPKEVVIEAPVKLKYPPELLKLKFTDASLRAIFQALGKFSGINFLFDEQFRDLPVSIDLTDLTV